MKKTIIAITALAVLALMLVPAYADITGHTWLGTTYTGPDGYYNAANIVAYQGGSTAVLQVTIQSPFAYNISVTRVYVTFDWGLTYNSTQVSTSNSTQILTGASRSFIVSFTVPNTTQASNLYLHSYTIFANYNFKNPANTTQTISTRFQTDLFTNFAVYSSDQATDMDMSQTLASYPSITFESAQAQILMNEALNETATANRYYSEGNFAGAGQHYSNALSDKSLAWSDEQAYQSMQQDLQTSQIQAEVNSMNAMTSFFNGLSTMWVLFGIGWVLLSIGYIVKWLRKRPEPQPAA